MCWTAPAAKPAKPFHAMRRTGPLPTTIKLDGVSMPTNLESGSVTCETAATSHIIYLDNKAATGGYDVDTLSVYGTSTD